MSLLGLSWFTWSGVPSHLKTSDGLCLSVDGIGLLHSTIGPGLGGSGSGNWHVSFGNAFLPPSDPHSFDMIPDNFLGRSLSYIQRHILVTHGYDGGFVTNSPPDLKAKIVPSSDFHSPPLLPSPSPSFSSDYDNDSEDNEIDFPSLPSSSSSLDSETAEDDSETYHICTDRETLDDICTLYDLDFGDVLKCNDDVLPTGCTLATVVPTGTQLWVSIYED